MSLKWSRSTQVIVWKKPQGMGIQPLGTSSGSILKLLLFPSFSISSRKIPFASLFYMTFCFISYMYSQVPWSCATPDLMHLAFLGWCTTFFTKYVIILSIRKTEFALQIKNWFCTWQYYIFAGFPTLIFMEKSEHSRMNRRLSQPKSQRWNSQNISDNGDNENCQVKKKHRLLFCHL